MNKIILNVSSRDNLEILLMIEISSRDLLNHPSWPGCPASFLQSYFSRRRSTSSPPRSSQAHSQSSSRLERYREMRRMRDASKNNLKWKEKWKNSRTGKNIFYKLTSQWSPLRLPGHSEGPASRLLSNMKSQKGFIGKILPLPVFDPRPSFTFE